MVAGRLYFTLTSRLGSLFSNSCRVCANMQQARDKLCSPGLLSDGLFWKHYFYMVRYSFSAAQVASHTRFLWPQIDGPTERPAGASEKTEPSLSEWLQAINLQHALPALQELGAAQVRTPLNATCA